MVGYVIVNIVGVQYYPGRISGREMVSLVREPLNVYDENAIKVLNTRGAQVGHNERAAARVLAPLTDTQFIFAEGIVPNAPKKARFKIPCQIHIFARIEACPVVKSAIVAGGLQLISDESPSFALSDSVVVKEKKNGKDVKNVDEIFKLVNDNVGKIGGSVEPLEPPKDMITSELFAHQKYGLGWLVGRKNSVELPPFWEEKDGMYVNVLTNYQSSTRPEPLRGGILADDMGLGKTLTLLSLIAYDKKFGENGDKLEVIDVDDGDAVDDSGGEKSKRGRKVKRGTNSRKKRKIDSSDVSGGVNLGSSLESKTTLVVCPPSVFSTWVKQLCEHTQRGSLKLCMYYGGERTRDVEEFRKYDIVLTKYSTLSVENSQSGSPVKKMNWR